MSDSKSSFSSLPTDFPTDPSSPSDLPPPAYTSIYDPVPPHLTSDTKSPPKNALSNLRNRIAANRSSSSDPAAILHRRLVSHMASRTEAFLDAYGTTGFNTARLTFCANGHVSPTSTEVLTGTAAEAAENEYSEFDVLDSDHFWSDRDAANGLAKGLERVLDERLGGLEKMRGEGVDLGVKEEEGGWRRENVFGIWETGTGWGVVVRVKVDA